MPSCYECVLEFFSLSKNEARQICENYFRTMMTNFTMIRQPRAPLMLGPF
jgi:hypothetical protein